MYKPAASSLLFILSDPASSQLMDNSIHFSASLNAKCIRNLQVTYNNSLLSLTTKLAMIDAPLAVMTSENSFSDGFLGLLSGSFKWFLFRNRITLGYVWEYVHMRFMICCYCRRLVFHLLLGTFVTFVSCFSRLYDSRRPALHMARRGGVCLLMGELLNADDHEFSSFTHTHTQPPPRELIDLKRMGAILSLSLSLYSLSSSLLFVRCRVPFGYSGGQSCRPTWHVPIPRRTSAASRAVNFRHLHNFYPDKLLVLDKKRNGRGFFH